MTGASAFEGQRVRVLDADGTPLTAAMSGSAEDETVCLTEVDSPEVLMTYYFGRGERLVVLEFDGLTVEGTLETWWLGGGRRWQIYVDRPLATLGPAGSVRPEQAAGRR